MSRETSLRIPLLLAFTAALAAGAANASPVVGVWRAPVKNAMIEVYDCGAEVCGKVVDSDDLRAHPDLRDRFNKDAALRERPIRGLQMMSGFKGGPSAWTGGTLYDPSSGNSYHGAITLVSHDTLQLKGCIFGPLCRSQTWVRNR